MWGVQRNNIILNEKSLMIQLIAVSIANGKTILCFSVILIPSEIIELVDVEMAGAVGVDEAVDEIDSNGFADVDNKDSCEPSETIQQLRAQLKQKDSELQASWKERDAILIREQLLQTQLSAALQLTTSPDNYAPAKGDVPASQPDGIPEELLEHKHTLLLEYDRLNNEVNELNRRLNLQRIYVDNVERRRADIEGKNTALYKVLDESSTEIMKEKLLLEQLKVQVADLLKNKQQVEGELHAIKTQNEHLRGSNHELGMQIEKLTIDLEHKKQRLNDTQTKLDKTAQALKLSTAECGDLVFKLQKNVNLLKLKESDIRATTKELDAMVIARNAAERRMLATDAAKSVLASEVLRMKSLIHTYEKDQEASVRATHIAQKQLDSVVHERDSLCRNLQKSDAIIDELRSTIKLKAQEVLVLQNEINSHLATIDEQRKLNAAVVAERNRNAAEAQLNAKRLLAKQQELELKLEQIVELTEALCETQQKLASAQRQLDDVTAERTIIKRELAATVEERELLRHKLHIASSQCAQLTEETSRKEQALNAAHKIINNLRKDIVSLKAEVHQLTAHIDALKTELSEAHLKNEQLQKALGNDEKQLIELHKAMKTLEREKDLVGSQLVRRNAEIALLYEKLQIYQMAIDRSECAYNQRLADIRLLTIEIANLQREKDLLKRTIDNTVDMRTENLRLTQALVQEQLAKKALEEEMTKPINIHRWRQLGGEDPDRLQLLADNQLLQRRLIQKSIEMAAQEAHFNESQTETQILIQSKIRASTNDFAQKLCKMNRKMKNATRQLKAAKAESMAVEIDARTE